MSKLTGAALDRAVANAMGLKSVNNCEKWQAPQPEQDGKCKLCVDGCIACDARAQPAQEPEMLTIAYQSGYHDGKKAAQRKWVGLTAEEIEVVYIMWMMRLYSGFLILPAPLSSC